MDRPRRNLREVSYAEELISDSEEVDDVASGVEDDASDISSEEERQIMHDQPLTSSEVIQTKIWIEKDTMGLDRLDKEYDELEEKLWTLYHQRVTIAQRMLVNRARISIMCKVPQDVLSMIFVHFVTVLRQSPWALMHVDRKWRQTALQTRTIWSGIEITVINWYKKIYPRSRYGREICTTEGQLRKALERAGQTDLDVRIHDCNPGGRTRRRRHLDIFEDLIRLFDDLGRNGGLRIVSLEAPCKQPGRKSVRLKEIKFPYLRQLGFTGDHPGLLQHIASSASTLQHLELDRVSFNSLNLSWKWWPKLVGLKIFFECPHGSERFYPFLTSLLSTTTTALQHLELRNYSIPLLNPPQLTLPKLLTLSTDAFLGPAQIVAPLLTHLTLFNSNCEVDATNEDPFRLLPPFPSLVHLDVQCKASRIRYIQAPSLHTLNFTPATVKQNQMRELWFGQTRNSDGSNHDGDDSAIGKSGEHRPNLLQPLVLRFSHVQITQETLIEILGSMDRLEELHIEGLMVKKGFFVQFSQCIDVLTSIKAESTSLASFDSPNSHTASNLLDNSTETKHLDSSNLHKQLPAPSLKRLSINLAGYGEARTATFLKNLLPVAKKCFKTRGKLGSYIESARVKVVRGGDWVKLA